MITKEQLCLKSHGPRHVRLCRRSWRVWRGRAIASKPTFGGKAELNMPE